MIRVSFYKKGGGGGETGEVAERPVPPAAPGPAQSRPQPTSPGHRASLGGCPKGGGRRGGAGRSRARRRAVPGRRPPSYTQHVNSPRREEPRD